MSGEELVVGFFFKEISSIEVIGIGAMLIVFGILIAIAMIWQIWSKKRDLAISLRANGQVVELVGRSGHKGRTIYAPRVAFQTAQNQVVYFVSPSASSPSPYCVGHMVEVYYNPQNPNRAGIVNDSVGNFSNILYLTLGIFTMFGGVICSLIGLMIYLGMISF